MRVGLYARVSTSDKDQNPETQLLPLREFVTAQGWELAGEFVDKASATDLRGRTEWKRLLTLASQRRVGLILVWRLDRAFRSVLHATSTIADLRRWGVGLRSYSESWLDTSGSSPSGDLMFHILTAVAQFERSLISERVRAGLARAQREGKKLGRPFAINGDWEKVRALIADGTLSQREAARQLGVVRSTVVRQIAREKRETRPPCA